MLNGRFVLGGFLLLITVAGMGSSDWPKMKLAKRELQKTQGYLYAENSKEGPLVSATQFVVSAIAEVDESIKLDSHNNHAQPQPTAVSAAPMPGKRNLRLALEHLKLGKEYLEAAKPDSGGHREKALNYTNKAIEAVETASAGTN
jgi:hypothetical protein